MRFSDLFLNARQAAGRLALAALLLGPAGAWSADAAGRPDQDNADIYGRWRLAKVLDSADIAAMSDRQAKAMLGEEVLIAKDRFKIGKRTCDGPSYERSVDDLAKSFREEGHVSSVNMGLPDPVTSIDAGCTRVYLKAPGRIVVHWDGFYFDAVRKAR
ncbi:hypothetical protein [Duganella violaceipulchra]|uniref:DUF3617 family protein n=1 Tax=Duganella violaceipulchra TaxID=2849652 RepID=A0AA41H7Y3_9BURK|nr:hypothetical protein [Duganella violaceicalia]MBV6323733.1 hypothetical protein [Duganella violaceicalia]MCP2007419.1 hypothetical protein [Duganella violaceicalia]